MLCFGVSFAGEHFHDEIKGTKIGLLGHYLVN
jgi:hypothetical protein